VLKAAHDLHRKLDGGLRLIAASCSLIFCRLFELSQTEIIQMNKKLRAINFLAICATMLCSPQLLADPEIEAAAHAFAEQSVSGWLANPVIVNAIKVQNRQHASLSQKDIDALDKQWRAETSGSPGSLVETITSNQLSDFLRDIKDGEAGLVTEIFVMDDKGLNVGQSDVTSDYWQGDEAKWKRTYTAEPNAMFVDEVEMDESTQRFQTQINIAITDPETGKNIGAVTVGVDAENLLMQ